MSPARVRLEASTRLSSSGDVIPPPEENIGAASKKAAFNCSSDNYSDRLLVSTIPVNLLNRVIPSSLLSGLESQAHLEEARRQLPLEMVCSAAPPKVG